MRLLGSLKRAFDAGRDAPPAAARLLTASTSCKGFEGKHRTKRWCCRLTAVLDVVLHRGAVPHGALAPLETHAALFFLLAPEMAWWERLRARGNPASAQAHLRHFVVDAALRLGMLWGRTKNLEADHLLKAEPAWADPNRRGELLGSLMQAAGFATAKAFCEATDFSPDAVTGWLLHGTRPTPDTLDRVSGFLSRRIPGSSRPAIQGLLTWHYALASIALEIEAAFGREFVLELGRLFCAVANQSAANLREAHARGHVEDRLAFAGLFHSLRTFPDVEVQVRLLRHVGAPADFVVDVEAAHEAWQSVVSPVRAVDRLTDQRVLVDDMPRVKNGERRKRRARRVQ